MKMEISLLNLRICKAMAMSHHRTEMEVILLFSSVPYVHPVEMEVRLQCNSIRGSLIRGTHPSVAEGRINVEADIHQGHVVVVAGIASS